MPEGPVQGPGSAHPLLQQVALEMSSMQLLAEAETEPFLHYQPLSVAGAGHGAGPPGREAPSDLSEHGGLPAGTSIACAALSDRALILGTHEGQVLLLDALGTILHELPLHGAAINDISIEPGGGGEYFATASDDGRVVVTSLYALDQPGASFNMRRPVKTVALEPGYSKRGTHQLVSGGTAENLVLSGRGWFAPKETILHAGEGPIHGVWWRDDTIVWTNDVGLQFLDLPSGTLFSTILKPAILLRSDLLRCRITWRGPTFFMAWGNTIQIGTIKRDFASKSLVLQHTITTDLLLCGVAPFGERLVVLSLPDSKLLSPRDPGADGTGATSTGRRSRNAPRPIPTADPQQQQQQPELQSVGAAPLLHVMDRSGTMLTSDQLPVPHAEGHIAYTPNDYHLHYLPAAASSAGDAGDADTEATYYIIRPKSILVARPRDMDDHIAWLTERRRYEEALLALRQQDQAPAPGSGGRPATPGRRRGKLRAQDIVAIGLKYMQELLDQERFHEAAAQCPKILQGDAGLWEAWIRQFAACQQLPALLPHVPTAGPQLPAPVYTFILHKLLEGRAYAGLVGCLRAWDKELYDHQALAVTVQAHLDDEHALEAPNEHYQLLEAAYLLHQHGRQWERVLHLGLLLHAPNISSLVLTHNLFPCLLQHVVLLLEDDAFHINTSVPIMQRIDEAVDGQAGVDPELGSPGTVEVAKLRVAAWGEGVQLLVQHTRQLPVTRVMEGLAGHARFQLIYLDALFRAHPGEGRAFHLTQARLLAQLDRDRLLDFLKASTGYPVPAAYEMCEELDLVPEMVYLLGKLGNARRALVLIIERLQDVGQAIAFAQEQGEEELWEEMLTLTMDKPAFLLGLLQHQGQHQGLSPLRILRRIPPDLGIPGLKPALQQVLAAYGVQLRLRAGCQRVILRESMELLRTLQAMQKRPLSFAAGSACAQCRVPLFSHGHVAGREHVVALFCGHAFHAACLPALQQGASSRREQSYDGRSMPDPLYARINAVYQRRPGGGGEGVSTTSGHAGHERLPHLVPACPMCSGGAASFPGAGTLVR